MCAKNQMQRWFLLTALLLVALSFAHDRFSLSPRAAIGAVAISMQPRGGQALGPISETEPNDNVATANAIPPGTAFVQASISSRDRDFFSFVGQERNLLYVSIETDALIEPDLALDIIGSNGQTIIGSDDDHGPVVNSPGIAGFLLPNSGTFFLRVRDLGIRDIQHNYKIFICIQPNTAAPEIEPNDSASTATPFQSINSGVIAGSGDVDFYSFSGRTGDTISIAVGDDPTKRNSGLDAVLTLFDPGGNKLAEKDLNSESPGEPEFINFISLPTTGTYAVSVRDFNNAGGATFTYYISLCLNRPNSAAPQIEPISNKRVDAGGRVQFTVRATDADENDTVTLSVSDISSAGRSFSLSELGARFVQTPGNPAIGAFTWAPSSRQAGVYIVVFTATDSGSPPLSGAETAKITVILRGDADGNGTINTQDLIRLIQILLGTGIPTTEADCDDDGSIGIQDLICLIKIISGTQ